MEFGLLALWLVISLLSLVFTPLKKLLRTMFGPQPPTCGLHTLFSAPSNLIQMTRSWSTLDLRLFTLVEVRACQYLHSQLSPRGIKVRVPLGDLLVDDPRAQEAAPKGDPVASGDLHCRSAALRPQGRTAGGDQA